MKSAFYGYYYIKTKNITITWDSTIIECFIENHGSFHCEISGVYKHNQIFCSINLMKVKSYDSWSGKDYNKVETNYISILTLKDPDKRVIDFLNDLAKFLSEELVEETDED